MIHIIFNESEIDLMRQVIAMDETLQGEVLQIKDDFAVGLLLNIDSEEGWQARVAWWQHLLLGSPYPESTAGSFDDRKTIQDIKSSLNSNPEEVVWIWMAQNQHDVCGYYWFISHFREFQGRVMVIYLNNLPFINEKGQLFYPSWLHEIQPKEFLKAKKLSRPVTLSEFEIDPDEWRKIMTENATIRMLEGGKKIVGKDDSFYDKEILKNTTPEWQKATRVLSNTLHRMKIKTGDVFLMWRLKNLVNNGKLQVTGDINKGWKDFDIKLPDSAKEEVMTENDESENKI